MSNRRFSIRRTLAVSLGFLSASIVVAIMSTPLTNRLAEASVPLNEAAKHAEAPALDRLASHLTGHFSSEAQSKHDPEFFDIRLHAVRIWTARDDGPWIYIEQARGDAIDRPYRQRIYRLEPIEEGRIRSDVYELPGDPREFVGAWSEPSRLDAVMPENLRLRAGCSVYLSFKNDRWIGSTQGKGCSSSISGASYATSEVNIDASGMSTWDRGYDANDQQVWGSVKGPYRFDRVP